MKKTVRKVFNTDDAPSTPAGIKFVLKGEPTLTCTVSGVAGSGKTVLAKIIEKSLLRYFESLEDITGLGGYVGCPINDDCRILIKTEITERKVIALKKEKPGMPAKKGTKKSK